MRLCVTGGTRYHLTETPARSGTHPITLCGHEGEDYGIALTREQAEREGLLCLICKRAEAARS